VSKTYAAREFAEALSKGLPEEAVTLLGMAKTAVGDTQAILFSGGGCESWTRIPLSLIASVTHVGSSSCGDHVHPEVEIELADPGGDAGVLYGLLRAAGREPRSARRGPGQGPIAEPLDDCNDFLELCKGFQTSRERRRCRAFVIRNIC
jgi:hypothetical protein